MSPLEDKAKLAAEARERLQAALMACANAVQAAAEGASASAVELSDAAAHERTTALASALEAAISQQRALGRDDLKPAARIHSDRPGADAALLATAARDPGR